jgi:hypothetical protein
LGSQDEAALRGVLGGFGDVLVDDASLGTLVPLAS